MIADWDFALIENMRHYYYIFTPDEHMIIIKK